MPSSLAIFIMLFITTTLSLPPASSRTAPSLFTVEEQSNPKPRAWPEQFHSILVMNFSGQLQLIDLWYDWTNGRNFNIIQSQLGHLLYDLEWNNGTSFFYTLDSNRQCSSVQLDIGIIRPNWLDGATYLGQRHVDGFLCNVWEKADFITYYEDVLTKRPVHWVFYTGRAAHVMTFEVGAALEDAKWQVPSYCFDHKTPPATTSDDAGFTKSDAQDTHDVVEQYMKDRANTIGTAMHRYLLDFGSMRASL